MTLVVPLLCYPACAPCGTPANSSDTPMETFYVSARLLLLESYRHHFPPSARCSTCQTWALPSPGLRVVFYGYQPSTAFTIAPAYVCRSLNMECVPATTFFILRLLPFHKTPGNHSHWHRETEVQV